MTVRSVLSRVVGWFRPGIGSAPPAARVVASTLVPAQHARWGRHHGPPQSRDEIRPIVEALQLMDRLLDVIWNPKHTMIEYGHYTPLGKVVDPVYEGRWQVIRHQTENLHPERGDYAVICTVTQYDRQDGILYFQHDGPYAPVDERLLELMRSADSQNVRQFELLRKKLWAQHDKTEEDAGKINEAEAREGLDRVHFRANYEGGVGNWKGRGADFTEPTPTPKPLILQP